jgi:hypothetical protein
MWRKVHRLHWVSQTALSVTECTECHRLHWVSQTALSDRLHLASQTALSVTDCIQCHRLHWMSQTALSVTDCTERHRLHWITQTALCHRLHWVTQTALSVTDCTESHRLHWVTQTALWHRPHWVTQTALCHRPHWVTQTALSHTDCTESHRLQKIKPTRLLFPKCNSYSPASVCRSTVGPTRHMTYPTDCCSTVYVTWRLLLTLSALTVPFLGHRAKAESSGREDEGVVMILIVNLQTLPRIFLHVNRRLNHVSVGVQEVAAHQQSELFWRFHLQNAPQSCRKQYAPPKHCRLSTWLHARWTQKTLVREKTHKTRV